VTKAVYVSTQGVDTNAGTQPAPVRTVAKATTLAAAGDSIMVESGVYQETVDSLTAFGNWKSGVTYQGFGPSPAILDGAGKKWTLHTAQGTGMTIDKLEIRNASETTVELDGVKGVASGFVMTNCHIHGANSKLAAPVSGTGWNSAIRIDWGNPRIQYNHIHDVGGYNESYGIFIDEARDYLIDSNVIYDIRKQCIRDYYSWAGVISNNFLFMAEGGIDFSGANATLAANNVVARTDYGIIAKHCNNVAFLQSVWGTTQSALPNPSRIWHNTVYDSASTHIEFAINLTGSQPDYLCLTNAQCNIFAGSSYISIYDAPAAREATPSVFSDYNIHPTAALLGQGLYRRGLAPASWTVLATLAALRADSTTGWEAHGQQLDPTFRDPVNNDFEPTVDYRAAVALAGSPWGNQIGARGVSPAPYKWQAEPVVTITSSPTVANLTKLVDGYGAITNVVMATLVESQSKTVSITCDLGSAKQISAFRWTPWSHNQWDNVQDYKLEGSASSAGPWTQIVAGSFDDYGGTTSNVHFAQPVTYRYFRFTALTNFLDGSGQTNLIGGSSDRLVFAEIELGNILAVNTAPPPTPVPTNTILPSLSGIEMDGQTLTVDPGTWNNALTFAYSWYRDGVLVSGQTGTTYLLTSADVNHVITCRVIASNATGPSTPATTPATGLIAAIPVTPPPTGRGDFWGIPS
jgi:hypothetical protein